MSSTFNVSYVLVLFGGLVKFYETTEPKYFIKKMEKKQTWVGKLAPCSTPTLLLTALREARFRLNRCDQLILCVYCGMKLGTIWKEAHSHFHGTCSVYPMQSVNINSPAHAFSRDIKEVWSEVMQR